MNTKSYSGFVLTCGSLFICAFAAAQNNSSQSDVQPSDQTETALDWDKIPCSGFQGLNVAKSFEDTSHNTYPSPAEISVDETNGRMIRIIRNALYEERLNKEAPKDEVNNALICNQWLANYTAAKNATSSTDSVEAFPSFNASFANNSQLVTTKFVTAFMPLFLLGGQDFVPSKKNVYSLDPQVNARAVNDIGVSISSSVPISSATSKDYAAQEILTHDGGLVNLYLSLSGRDYTNEAYSWGDRKANLDHLYFVDVLSNCNLSGWHVLAGPACLLGYNTAEEGMRQPATAKEALGYITQGIGVKALKTSLSGNSSLGAQGTIYGGLGVDGPLFYAAQDSSSAATKLLNNPAGMASLDVYVAGNIVSQGALNSLFGAGSAGHTFLSWGVNFTLYVTNSIGIQLQYAVPFESSVNHTMGPVTMLKIGYTKPSTSSGTTK